MRALVAEAGEFRLADVPRPRLSQPGDVLIRVVVAGICRTDAYVAHGTIPTDRAITLGHELAGVIEECGAAVTGFKRGDRVSADPQLRCGDCQGCEAGPSCFRPRTLGIDHHGCFADYLILPAESLHKIPEGMTPFDAAFVEPVAACLAIFNAGMGPGDRGVVAGSNRFSSLARALLAQRAFDWRGRMEDLEECSLDFAVETGMDAEALRKLVWALKPSGTLILKSRSPKPLPLPARDLVGKKLRVQAVSYGCFDEAIHLLSEGKVALAPEGRREVALEDYERELGNEVGDESAKAFFVLSGAGGWPCVA
jgi:threonine dehydrogenase-like Zn-dependent dehydrogenase